MIGLSSGSPQERFRRSPPYPEPFPELNLPAAETHVLSNGLTLAVVRRENQPIISLRLLILSGESVSPDRLPGLATLTAHYLIRGTQRLSASDIEEAIEAIGGNLVVHVSPDYTAFSLSFLEEYFDEAFQVLSDILIRPTFPRNEIGNVQRNMYYEIARQSDNPEFIAKRVLLQILFKDHPYRKILYEPGMIKNIKRKDVLSFYDRHYRPNNSRLVIVGNLNLEMASRRVSRYLSPWQKQDLRPAFPPPLQPINELNVCFVDLQRARDATVFLGNVIFPIHSPDYFPFIVFNQIIGGTPTSRLFMHLRESRGYAYYAFSEMEFYRSCGVFLVRTRLRPEVTYRAIQDILKEIEATTARPLSTYEIEQAKSYLIGNFPLSIESPQDLAERISEILAFGLERERWDRYFESLMNIDPVSVSRVVSRYSLLTPVVVVVGPSTIIPSLREFDEVRVYNPEGQFQYVLKKGETE
ncbi:MAG: M16 family metallopeptidase [Candidatus Aminicenantales bacterium]